MGGFSDLFKYKGGVHISQRTKEYEKGCDPL